MPTAKKLKLIEKFVKYCASRLDLTGNINIVLSRVGQKMPTAGHFDPSTRTINVTIINRALADCLRTISHELTHLSQLDRGIIFPTRDELLQPYEDEANIMSGRLVRFFGRENPEIYRDIA